MRLSSSKWGYYTYHTLDWSKVGGNCQPYCCWNQWPLHSKYQNIWKSKSIVEHELLEANEIAIAQEYINYRTKRDFERSQATDINFTISKLVNKDQAVVHENANKDSDLYNTQRDLTAGIVGKIYWT